MDCGPHRNLVQRFVIDRFERRLNKSDAIRNQAPLALPGNRTSTTMDARGPISAPRWPSTGPTTKPALPATSKTPDVTSTSTLRRLRQLPHSAMAGQLSLPKPWQPGY